MEEILKCPECGEDINPLAKPKPVKMTLSKNGKSRSFVFCLWAHAIIWASKQDEKLNIVFQ